MEHRPCSQPGSLVQCSFRITFPGSRVCSGSLDEQTKLIPIPEAEVRAHACNRKAWVRRGSHWGRDFSTPPVLPRLPVPLPEALQFNSTLSGNRSMRRQRKETRHLRGPSSERGEPSRPPRRLREGGDKLDKILIGAFAAYRSPSNPDKARFEDRRLNR